MNEDLLERLLDSPRLPSLPAIAIRVVELVQKPEVTIEELAEAIRHDPALSSRILKTVNSSYYGQNQEVTNLHQALVVLGLRCVKTLALGFTLTGPLKEAGGKSFDQMAYWKRSLFAATAARAVARVRESAHQEEAFLGGLLQDVGVLTMSQVLGSRYIDFVTQQCSEHAELARREQEAFDLDHTMVGEAMARKWGLPAVLCAPIRYHETPEQAVEQLSPELMPLVSSVVVGSRAAEVFVHPDPGAAMARYRQEAEQVGQLSGDEAMDLLEHVHRETWQMQRLFELPTGELGQADQILAEANQALAELSLENEQRSTELARENKRLARELSCDTLTGIANRRKFNAFLHDQFQRSLTTGRPLSLIFLDTDHFKDFNDRHGHPVGDRVLVELAGALHEVTPSGSLAARYGGEEFVFVLPGMPRVEAARFAEQVRRCIGRLRVEGCDGTPLSVSASIGVATQDGSVFQRVEQLIKAADQGVYAAKTAGRNCVRIFTPRAMTAAANACPAAESDTQAAREVTGPDPASDPPENAPAQTA